MISSCTATGSRLAHGDLSHGDGHIPGYAGFIRSGMHYFGSTRASPAPSPVERENAGETCTPAMEREREICSLQVRRGVAIGFERRRALPRGARACGGRGPDAQETTPYGRPPVHGRRPSRSRIPLNFHTWVRLVSGLEGTIESVLY